MDEGKRIYRKKIKLQYDYIREFYNKRAEEFENKGYSVVLLGDDKEGYANKWDVLEKKRILPYLNIDRKKVVLDIGCGIGRWAETIAATEARYIGIDYSEKMINVAQKNFKDKLNVTFLVEAFQNIFKNEEVIRYSYDVIIITGVCMYVNDEDLMKCFNELIKLLNYNGIIYIEESIGVEKRLTLDSIYSKALESNYSAIYRTRDEYIKLMSPLYNHLDVINEGFFNELDKSELKETGHWYVILRKTDK